MTVLLDTHVLLWALADPERLSDSRRRILEDRSNTVLVSAVNAAEIAIKASIGKLTFDDDLLALVDETGFEWIGLTAEEAMMLRTLPPHHRDPFDRMLVCQALSREVPLVTDDPKIEAYGCRVV
ncbi:MAG: type II toxin-antitoxin system VapC family toxin [Spirochaetota bacterium]